MCRLETAFWHRYPQLHQISSGFIDHLNSSLRLRLKDRVGDLVLKAWACVEIVKHECFSKGIEEFKTVLERDTARLLRTASTDTEAFLEEFFDEHTNTTLQSLFSLYPLSAGVVSTGIGLTRKRKEDFSRRHMDYYCTYAKKKISEVCSSCIQQRVKKEEGAGAGVSRSKGEVASDVVRNGGLHRGQVIREIFGEMASLQEQLHRLVQKLLDVKGFAEVGGSVTLRDQSNSSDRLPEGNLAMLLSEMPCSLEVAMPTDTENCFLLTSFCGHICITMSEVVITVGKILLLGSCSEDCPHPLWRSSRQRALISSCVSMITGVFSWCRKVRSECVEVECAGRIRIEVMKMLTVIGSALFLLDMVWTETETAADGEGSAGRPSGLLVEACRLNLITPEGFTGVIAPALKPTIFSTMYFHHDVLTKANQCAAILKCIAGLLCLKSRELDLDLDIDIQEGSWLTDPAVKRAIKTSIAPDLALLIDQVVISTSDS
jgi:hypothetical protein